jgi:hypothetical protein
LNIRMRYLQSLRSTATSITRRYPFYRYISHFLAFNIGRKHKAHRQQAQQERPWRNAEKGRRGKGKSKQGKMGQDESRVVDPSVPPTTLKARTLEALAEYIKDGRAQKIVVMVGAVTSPSYVRVLTVGRQVPAQVLSGHTRLQVTGDGAIRKPRAPQPTVPEAVLDIEFFR